MGTIKFELDIPDFEKEISINVVIKKDGEVAYSTSSSSPSKPTETTVVVRKKKKADETPTPPTSSNSGMSGGFVGGNMMNIDF
jgi:hypothetical protein